VNETEPYNERFGLLGYESSYFVVNLELLLYVFFIYLGLFLVLLILKLLQLNNAVVQKVIKFLSGKLVFSFLI